MLTGGTRRKATGARTSTRLASLERSRGVNSRDRQSDGESERGQEGCECVCVCVFGDIGERK